MGEAYFTDVTDATRMTLGVGNLTFTVPHKVRRHPHGWAFSPKSLDGRAVVAREFRASRMPWRRRERERESKKSLCQGDSYRFSRLSKSPITSGGPMWPRGLTRLSSPAEEEASEREPLYEGKTWKRDGKRD